MDHSEFEEDKRINPGQLDIESCQQADLFFKWAERAIEARHDMDTTKAKRDMVEMRIQMQVRKAPHKFGIEKVTEATITATAKIHADVEKANDDYLNARRNSGMLDAAVSAMEMKKRMIEVMITLHGQKYFAGPSVPRDLVSAYQEISKEREEGASDRQKARARKRRRRAGKSE